MEHKYVTPLIMWAIILLGVIVFFLLVPQGAALSEKVPAYLLFFPALAYALYFYSGALKVNTSPGVSAVRVTKLITSGPYAYVRHPLYSANIVLAWGIFFAFPSLRLLTAVIWATAIFVYWAKLEEEALTEKFGETYRIYQKQTPMLFPNFWKKLFSGE